LGRQGTGALQGGPEAPFRPHPAGPPRPRHSRAASAV